MLTVNPNLSRRCLLSVTCGYADNDIQGPSFKPWWHNSFSDKLRLDDYVKCHWYTVYRFQQSIMCFTVSICRFFINFTSLITLVSIFAVTETQTYTTDRYPIFIILPRGAAVVQWLRRCILSPNEPGFNSRWYPYESLVAARRASGESCSRASENSHYTWACPSVRNESVFDVKSLIIFRR